MKAMILAAGRGKRMGHLTNQTPKPLLRVGDKTLIEWQIIRLRQAGFEELVINLGYLGEQIAAFLGDGSRYDVNIQYSIEPQTGLETGGGVFQALPLLGDKPFLLTNADVFTDYPYAKLMSQSINHVHLVLVDNPAFKTSGDFAIDDKQLIAGDALTFAGVSVVNPEIFQDCESGFYSIVPLFKACMTHNTATAEHYQGAWHDVGTPERLEAVNAIGYQ